MISNMIGKTFSSVKEELGELVFRGTDSYKFYHEQDCCESVHIEEMIGDLKDLENSPLLLAEEIGSPTPEQDVEDEMDYDSCTWTFYKFATIKGYVTVRWLGESNGYYSERVDFCKL